MKSQLGSSRVECFSSVALFAQSQNNPQSSTHNSRRRRSERMKKKKKKLLRTKIVLTSSIREKKRFVRIFRGTSNVKLFRTTRPLHVTRLRISFRFFFGRNSLRRSNATSVLSVEDDAIRALEKPEKPNYRNCTRSASL